MLCVFFNSVNHDTPDFASMSHLSLYRMVSIQYSYDGNLSVLYSKLRSSTTRMVLVKFPFNQSLSVNETSDSIDRTKEGPLLSVIGGCLLLPALFVTLAAAVFVFFFFSTDASLWFLWL